MTPIAVHTCSRCELRFSARAELDDHIGRDHVAAAEVPPPRPLWGQVCVAVDPTRGLTPSVRVAAAVARQASMAVELVAVPPPGLGLHITEAHLRSRAEEAVRTGTPTAWNILDPGDVADELLAHVAEGDTTMLCMDSRSRGPVAEMALGSVSEAVVRTSPVPVLMVGPRVDENPDQYSTLLVAVDGSAESEAAVGVAASIAARLGADLALVQVLPPSDGSQAGEVGYLRRVARRLPASRTSYDVLHDHDAARAIVGAVEQRPEAIIAMGTHGRTGLRRVAMGSVALDVVKHAPCPVLVVNSATEALSTPPAD